jgi:drug/metabolite transporter (DMT)-like permease
MIAEQTVASGFAALIIAIIPLWVTGFEYVSHSSERLSARGIFGIILGFVGLAVLVAPDVLNQKFTLSISEGMLVLATLFWAAGSWVQRRHKFHASLFTLSAAQMLASGTVMGVISLAQNDCRLEVLAAVNTQSWLALAYLIVFGSCTAFTAYVYLLRNVPASRVATYAYVNPIVAVLLGALILHESLTISMLAGMTIILVSLSMVRS